MKKRGLMILALLGVFGVTLAWLTLHLRDQVRSRMLEQEGATLEAVARFEAVKGGRSPLELVLGMVDLEGAIGVRIYDGAGNGAAALPASLTSGRLPGQVADALRAGSPVARLEAQAWLDTEFADPFGVLTEEAVPLLRVYVSLGAEARPGEPAFAEFLFDGGPLAAALASLDRKLLLLFVVAFGVGAGLLLLIVIASFRSIDRKNRELAEANRELTMQAKTSAVGAVSAHLIHGLRNALGGMRQDAGDNGAAAAETARRMQAMIQEIVDIIQEDAQSLRYSLSSGEILGLVAERMHRVAGERGVSLETEGDPDAAFTNREGNLVLLILENLVRNAIEATPPGRRVVTRYEGDRRVRAFFVRDHGPGFPDEARKRPFQPVQSAKPGGSGIGLSISRHLARQLGAELELVRSGADGSEFALRLPSAGGEDR